MQERGFGRKLRDFFLKEITMKMSSRVVLGIAMSLSLYACGADESHELSATDSLVVPVESGMALATVDMADKPLMDIEDIFKQNQLHEAETIDTDHFESLAVAPSSYSLASYQTGIRNQADRRTCWIFAAVAAIEARYKRDFRVDLDLSEQYFNHVAKSTGISYPKFYLYENQSSYWGGGGSHVVAEAKTYMIPLETYAPYKNQSAMDAIKASIPAAGALDWRPDAASNRVTQEQVDAFEYSPLYIPMAARANAKYGVSDYSLYDGGVARNTSRLEELIASNHEVIIDIDLKWKQNPTTGIFDYDASSAGGGHAFLLVGYDRAQQYFLVKNSWGDAGLLKVSYNFFRNCAQSAAVVNAVYNPNQAPQEKARWMGFWHQDHDGWKGKLTIRRINNISNDATRLGTYYGHDQKPHSINGISLDAGHGLRFFIAQETENAPGSLTGQKFEVDQYTRNLDHAAGTTWWAPNGQGGVYLGRRPMNAPYGNNFTPSKWVGSWDMNHDGWAGVLQISAVTATGGDFNVALQYTDSSGQVRTANGTLERARPTIMRFNINFPGNTQSFVLHYHGWDDRLASGFTHWSGVRFGAHAYRR